MSASMQQLFFAADVKQISEVKIVRSKRVEKIYNKI